MSMLESYRQHAAERGALGIPPLPLSADQTKALIDLLRAPPDGEAEFLLDLMVNRVPAGVDDAAKVKAEFLARVAKGEEARADSRVRAAELLGTMLGGFNVKPLVDCFADAEVRRRRQHLKHTLLRSTLSTTSRN